MRKNSRLSSISKKRTIPKHKSISKRRTMMGRTRKNRRIGKLSIKNKARLIGGRRYKRQRGGTDAAATAAAAEQQELQTQIKKINFRVVLITQLTSITNLMTTEIESLYLNKLDTLNAGIYLSSNNTSSFVAGFLADLAFLLFVIKLPNPLISILSPRDNDSLILFIIPSSTNSVSTFDKPVISETSLIISNFVI